MALAPAIVLHSPVSDEAKLRRFVEQCILECVELIAIVGPGCAELENEIDWLVIGDGSADARFVVTSSHPEESIDDVLEFAAGWRSKTPGCVQEVKL